MLKVKGNNMDYEKKLALAKEALDSGSYDKETIEYIFPELAESDDERIRKAIIEFFELQDDNTTYSFVPKKDIIAWLEKQSSDISLFYSEQRKYMGKYVSLDKITLIKLLAERDANNAKIAESFEKQGEHVNFISKIQVGDKVTRNEDGMLVNLSQLKRVAKKKDEKQGEQKPYTSETMNEKGDFDNGFTRMMEKEQKPTDKVEPKFREGDWVVVNDGRIGRIVECTKDFADVDLEFSCLSTSPNNIRSWTIQDAKDGDVLAAHECLVLFKEIDGLNIKCHCTYHYMNNPSFYINTLQNKDAFSPATKEQRNQLERAIADAGYKWDAEHKQLNKIEQKHTEWSEEDEKMLHTIISIFIGFKNYGSSSLIEQFEECINWLKPLKDRVQLQTKYEWSEEDETVLSNLIWALKEDMVLADDRDEYVSWLQSLKDKTIPQPKQEWSEEDRETIDYLIDYLESELDSSYTKVDKEEFAKEIELLKSLRPQNTWKPSDEQIEALEHSLGDYNIKIFEDRYEILESLYQDLKKLREEQL